PASPRRSTVHSPALIKLIGITVSSVVIDYVVDRTYKTVDHAMQTTHNDRSKSVHDVGRSGFTMFVSRVMYRAGVTAATLLTALVYIDRSRPHLCIAVEKWALERVFLGALIVASKYTNDSPLKNVHWATCTGVFHKRDIGRIEREFLEVLDWELGFSEGDLLAHYEGL
ncbi:Cyclin, N-terminal domain-containing protein, partial [Mycena metata]